MQCVPPPPAISDRDPLGRLVFSIWYISARIKQNNSALTAKSCGLKFSLQRAALRSCFLGAILRLAERLPGVGFDLNGRVEPAGVSQPRWRSKRNPSLLLNHSAGLHIGWIWCGETMPRLVPPAQIERIRSPSTRMMQCNPGRAEERYRSVRRAKGLRRNHALSCRILGSHWPSDRQKRVVDVQFFVLSCALCMMGLWDLAYQIPWCSAISRSSKLIRG